MTKQPKFTSEIIWAITFLSVLAYSAVVFNLGTPFRLDIVSQILQKRTELSQSDCDFSKGKWIRVEETRYYDENCPFLDPGFRCRLCGRKDQEYLKWRWKPEGCVLPRFNAWEFLERNKNRRIVFAGDSIGRNQWESFLCMLAKGVSNISSIYEENGSPISKHKGFLSMRFSEQNLTIQYYRAPFLVAVGRPPENTTEKVVRKTIKVDRIHPFSKRWVGADALVFNAGHWWNEYKTLNMGCYFEEGGKVNISMTVKEAFKRSLQTLKAWALENLSSEKSCLLFRSYSPVHFRNGSWNSGGRCDVDFRPAADIGTFDPGMENNAAVAETIRELKEQGMRAEFVDISFMSQFRFDGHPSVYREPGTPVPAPQDCSHWCLPGVPDTWNEILFSKLTSK